MIDIIFVYINILGMEMTYIPYGVTKVHFEIVILPSVFGIWQKEQTGPNYVYINLRNIK